MAVTLSKRGINAKITRDKIAAARKISGAGIKSVVIVSAPPSVNGMFFAEFIAFPIIGPKSIGMRTKKIILTP